MGLMARDGLYVFFTLNEYAAAAADDDDDDDDDESDVADVV